MNFEANFNDKALEYWSTRNTYKPPVDAYNKNCTPTYVNPISQKAMQFASWTNHKSDDSDGHLAFARNVCGDKTPTKRAMSDRKAISFCTVLED